MENKDILGENFGHQEVMDKMASFVFADVRLAIKDSSEVALIDALDRLWENVTDKKMYVTGAVGQAHYGASTNRELIQEGFIDAYKMPNLTAYNETCANICNFKTPS